MDSVKIPVEEAIYYLEDALRDAAQLFSCVHCGAPIMHDWLRKVNNILRAIYGRHLPK